MAVPAAGTGTRMGGRRKPFIPLAGQPLLRHALAPFLAHPWVRSVVVALHPEDHRAPPVWLRELDPRIRIVSGGATRVHSVSTAVDALFPEVSWVMVHDGARPLVTDTIVERCARAAYSGRAALAGWPVTDTIKEVGRRRRVRSTPERSRLWAAQTPQVFPRRELAAACSRALEAGFPATDDAEIFARYAGAVDVVEGAPWNLKVTQPEDLAVAEALLRERGRAEPPQGRR
ncbi:MAG: 2-C-methyl-D-erythritol 4-phosphate cytidylyltransferase [Gammaproteobacteria bacterium]|nr:2-C-methyl-D-erythritol 4-phosphate cytidylyltransferase [Gammaproteobacteria bacterium]